MGLRWLLEREEETVDAEDEAEVSVTELSDCAFNI